MPGGPAAPWWAFVLAGACYGLLTGLSLPPAGVWPLALIAIVPLVWAGCRGSGVGKRAGLLAALGTLPFWFFEHWWLTDVTAAGYPLLSTYLALYSAIFVWALAHARRADWPIPMSIVVPVLWTCLEVVRGEFGLDGYAWFLLAHPLVDAPILAAPASMIGTYGVTFLCAALAGAVADASGWSGIRRSHGGIGALALLVIWPALGLIGAAPEPSGKSVLRVAVVQTNLPQSNKMWWSTADRLRSMKQFLDLTRQAAAQRPTPDVIAWPETMFPGPSLNGSAAGAIQEIGLHWKWKEADGEHRVEGNFFRDELLRVQTELGAPMLIGSSEMGGDIAGYYAERDPKRATFNNSVVLLEKGSVATERYDKLELTPFGEKIPHVNRWPRLQQIALDFGAAGMKFDLTAGKTVGGLDVPVSRGDFGSPGVRVATPICFEVTRADLCRRLVRGEGGAPCSLIINFSNDGWFGDWDGGRRQHMLAARWRCVELGVPMVRCVNTGVSSQIDAAGRVVNQQLAEKSGPNDRTDGVMLAVVPVNLTHEPTLFERVGLIPAYVVMASGLAAMVVFWRRSRQVGGMA